MYNHRIFAEGVHSVLRVQWDLQCETPLAIRNGLSISYTDNAGDKSRGQQLQYAWDETKKHKVSTLHYGYTVTGGQVRSCHFVPASSVRGALRAWTLQHIVHPDFRSGMTPPPMNQEEASRDYLDRVRRALARRTNGYQLVASLFGLAVDTREEDEPQGNAGRLHVQTTPFDQGDPSAIQANGTVDQGAVGPTNAERHMTVRNPLDRLTHTAKDKGLHHFLEFAPGQTFAVDLTLLNPQDSDLGVLSLWVREMNAGLLRLGALSSIGRGRVSVAGQHYHLWRRPGAPLLNGRGFFEEARGDLPDDVLTGLWAPYVLPPEHLGEFEVYLQEHV